MTPSAASLARVKVTGPAGGSGGHWQLWSRALKAGQLTAPGQLWPKAQQFHSGRVHGVHGGIVVVVLVVLVVVTCGHWQFVSFRRNAGHTVLPGQVWPYAQQFHSGFRQGAQG